MNAKSIKQQHHELFIEAMRARQHYGIYNILTNDVDVPRFRKIMEEYPEFFDLTIAAHLYAVVIRLGKLFDNKNVSIPRLLKRIKKSANADDVAAIEKKVQAIAHCVKKITNVRHGALAHLSIHSTPKEIFKAAGMTDDDLNILTQTSLEILGDIGPFVDGITNVEFNSAQDSTRAMLTQLEAVLRPLTEDKLWKTGGVTGRAGLERLKHYGAWHQ